jgi:hypothetical protein
MHLKPLAVASLAVSARVVAHQYAISASTGFKGVRLPHPRFLFLFPE